MHEGVILSMLCVISVLCVICKLCYVIMGKKGLVTMKN